MAFYILLLCVLFNTDMAKGKEKVDGEGSTHERTIIWDEDQTKFMLGWFIDYIKEQHVGFKLKKQHHFKYAEALNRQFNMGVTATQVERHFRHYKENWKFIATALAKSGNTFDAARRVVNISASEKATLNVFSISHYIFLTSLLCSHINEYVLFAG